MQEAVETLAPQGYQCWCTHTRFPKTREKIEKPQKARYPVLRKRRNSLAWAPRPDRREIASNWWALVAITHSEIGPASKPIRVCLPRTGNRRRVRGCGPGLQAGLGKQQRPDAKVEEQGQWLQPLTILCYAPSKTNNFTMSPMCCFARKLHTVSGSTNGLSCT